MRRAGQSWLVAVRALESRQCPFGMKMLLDDSGVVGVLMNFALLHVLTAPRQQTSRAQF